MLKRLREKWGWFDHGIRAVDRYKEDCGDRLAAAVSYYGFLSIFPLLLLGVSVLGYVVADPLQSRQVLDALQRDLPGLGDQVAENLAAVAEHRESTGLIGLAGLAWSGTGWIGALRESLRTVWHQEQVQANIVKRKLIDLATLAGLGGTVALSLVLSGVVPTVLAFPVGLVTDTLLFGYLFTRLPRNNRPLRRVLRGALFAAAGFAALKVVGRVYVTRVIDLGAEVYGVFAVMAGLLIWINLASRWALFAAVWTVTAEEDSDVRPSGTAEPYPVGSSDRIPA